MSVIKIRVENDTSNSTGSGSGIANEPIDNINPNNPNNTDANNKVSWKQAVLVGNAVSVGRAGFHFAVANYGDLTNDYAGGVRLQEGLDLLGTIGGVGAGFLVGGVGGGIASLVAVGINTATQIGNQLIQTNKKNKENAVLRERYGVALNNGGR